MRICGSAGGSRRLMRVGLGAAVTLVPAAVASAAGAATIGVSRPCLVNVGTRSASMIVSGSGFVPGDEVHITSSDGSVDATGTADPGGSIAVTTGAPNPFFKLPGAKTVTLTARDFALAGTITATAPVMVTTLAAVPRPTRAKLTSKVTWYFSGFRPGKYVYGHYLRRKQVARVRFGRAKGPCGLLKVRAGFYPGGHPPFDSYTLALDTSRRYSRKTRPRVLLKIHKVVL
jgi:hypothetical protein